MGKRKKKKAPPGAPVARSGAQEGPLQNRPFARALEGLRTTTDKAQAEKAPAQPCPAAPDPPVGRPSVRPPEGLSEDDRDALGMAMVGVEPLRDGRPRRVPRGGRPGQSRTADAASQAEGAEERARARLDALVAAGVSFQVERNEEYVRGARSGLDPGVLRRLSRRRGADDTVDLHGLSRDEARRALRQFVREAHRQGLELVCVVHGKGLHSEGGQGVLRELCLETLTESGCAPCVRAFCTAPASLGGTGALLVELARR